ncbi:uncharacterized protein [Spinacia oleracea]|uniref:Uncharacterized protein n=1 Tax=Spinacia oleracea TaxID=3562 RepID=A0ABM3QHW8_SPIOL|nr:uncharacterized protein LOC110775637 [Spinacia oleracea]XP_056682955.1 uncharacterized protein LOC110775637 [Spinacia oleracea]
MFVFVGASVDTVGVGAKAVEKTAVLLGVPLKDRAFCGIKFEREELSQEEENSEPANMSTSTGTGPSTRSGKAPSADALLKKRLEALGSVSRPKPVTVVSPRRPLKASNDSVVIGEMGTSFAAEFKLPPPTRKRKLTVEFPDDFGSADAPQHQLWLEVDRLWMPSS